MAAERKAFDAQFRAARECGWIRTVSRGDAAMAVWELADRYGFTAGPVTSASFSESQYVTLSRGGARIRVRFSSHQNGAYTEPRIVNQDGMWSMWFLYEHQIIDLEGWMQEQG